MQYQDGVYQYTQDAMHPVVHCVKVEDGIVTDAWIYQVHGDYRSSGGWERSVIGKRAADLDMTGFRRRSNTNTKERTAELHAVAMDLVSSQVQAELDEMHANAQDLERARRLRSLAEQHMAATGCSASAARQHIAKALRLRRGERIAADNRGGARVGAGAPAGNDNRWHNRRHDAAKGE